MITPPQLPTQFAPPERAELDQLRKQIQLFEADPLTNDLINVVPEVFMVLNEHRQIVFANDTLLELLGWQRQDLLKGMRPGEALSCIHATSCESGCGTSEFCRTCGAVKAILSSLNGHATTEECRITRQDGSALDLQVWAKPLRVGGELFSTFAVKDISSDKRRRALERIFFHDIMNTAGTMSGFAELLREANSHDEEIIRDNVYRLSYRLIEEIQAQKSLTEAENGELLVQPVPVDSLLFLQELKMAYEAHPAAKGRTMTILPEAQSVALTTDAVLLRRVIGNLIKNALEAARPTQTVTLSCAAVDSGVEFTIHNPNFIPRNIQLQIFQRSFSTKGPGRGLGTYSVKLLTERYLQGQVSFVSLPEAGTQFLARYPLALAE